MNAHPLLRGDRESQAARIARLRHCPDDGSGTHALMRRATWKLIPLDLECEDPWTGQQAPSLSQVGGGSDSARILVPYNGSTTARKALDVAVGLAQGPSVAVWVLYVRSWEVGKGGGRFCFEGAGDARRCAQEAVDYLQGRGIAANAIVQDARRERVPHAIVAQADELGVNCIVLGTGAHGPMVSALLGSTSRAVARRSTRRVITVTDPQRPRPR